MSGGIDSSVAAALLARSGRTVVGFSMQLVDRLHEANRRFDLQIFPNAAHGIGRPYPSMRWEYFHQHLIARPNGGAARPAQPARSGAGPF